MIKSLLDQSAPVQTIVATAGIPAVSTPAMGVGVEALNVYSVTGPLMSTATTKSAASTATSPALQLPAPSDTSAWPRVAPDADTSLRSTRLSAPLVNSVPSVLTIRYTFFRTVPMISLVLKEY